ncbi:hypothetical protein D3C71_1613140 [compost metagenome]
MIGANRLLRFQGAVGNRAHQHDQIERCFSQIDLAPEQREPRTVTLRLRHQLKRIAGGARSAAKNADDQFGIERGEFLQRLRPVIGHLEKQRSLGTRHARQ